MPTDSQSRCLAASTMVIAWTAASRLGGLGTGYFTLEGSGKIGYCSIFNDIVPPRADFSEWLTVKIAGGGKLAAVHGGHRLLGASSRRGYGLSIWVEGS